MRLDRLTTWEPAPGRVVVWRPSDASQAAADAAPVDPGPPSFLQGDHLAGYRATVARGGTHRAWTGAAANVDAEGDLDAVGRALTAFVRRHEGLRTWFDVSDATPVRHLVPPDAVAFEAHEVPVAGEWAQAWCPLLVDLFDAACTPDSWAPFLLGAIVREGSFDLFWGCDHAFTDGASQLMVLPELADLYAEAVAERTTPDPTPAADQGSFLAYVREEQARAASYAAGAPEIDAWIDIVGRHEGRLPRVPVDLGLAPGETAPVLPRETTALTGEEVTAFERLCHDHGAGFTAGVFAALALADTSLTGADRWLGITVVGTRGPAYQRTQGWLCNFVPVEFAVPGSRAFGETVKAASDAFGQAKALAAMPVHVALGAMVAHGVIGPDQIGSPQLISYLDLRRFSTMCRPGAGAAAYETGLHFTGEGRTANASLWINREHDRLQLGAQTPDTPVAQAAVDRYHRRILDVFAGTVGRLADAGHHG